MATSGALLPTPAVSDTFTGNLKSSQQSATSKHSVNLPQALNHPYYSPAGSLASPSAKPDEEKERQTSATSGRRCFASYESFLRYGSLLKTCVGSLLRGGAWYSSRCALIWKAQGTKSSRLLFQLSPSMRRTEGIEFGLLPTSRSRDYQKAEKPGARLNRGAHAGEDLPTTIAMLPTPDANDGNRGPTKTYDPHVASQSGRTVVSAVGSGTGLKLQPAFALWMMGYPTDWCDLADGEMPRSKQQATLSSRKSRLK